MVMADSAAYSGAPESSDVFYAFGQDPVQVAELLLDQYILSTGYDAGGRAPRATQLILEVGWSSAGDAEGNPYEGTLLVVW